MIYDVPTSLHQYINIFPLSMIERLQYRMAGLPDHLGDILTNVDTGRANEEKDKEKKKEGKKKGEEEIKGNKRKKLIQKYVADEHE